ncbi:MAG: PBP1A family penicillin-binding protein [Clostridia bacterium]
MSKKYSSVSSNLTEIKKSKKYKKRSKLKAFFKYFFITCIILGFIAVGLVAGYVYSCVGSAELITDEMLQIEGKQNTIVYDSLSKQISMVSSSEKREIVPISKIPKHVQNAFIAIEDERFRDHNGFDFYAFMRAATKKLTDPSNREGGSTITMQLVKNLTGKDTIDIKRKIQEAYLAMNLETRISKDTILYLYLNLINFNGVYGVQAASEKYFGKSVTKLSIAEGASLAAIIKGPSIYGPTTKEGIKNNLERQKLVLESMLNNKFITQAQYDKAIATKLKFSNRPTTNRVAIQNAIYRPYFVDNVLKEVKSDLIKLGYSEDGAVSAIYGGGLKIYTTMDSSIQKQMNSVFNNESYFPNRPLNGKKVQASMVIIDPTTGQIKAMYGGHGKKSGDFLLNRATDIERQPGSSIKPIAVYGPALDQGIITQATVIDDAPSHMLGGSRYYPTNATGGYGGFTPIWLAIQRSVNVVAAKVYQLEGPDNALDYLSRVNINRTQKNVSLSLGGMYQGVSPLQMAAAYVPFVRKGIYIEPTTYSKVVDSKGRVILDKRLTEEIKQKTKTVYQPGTAYIMQKMMTRVVTNGTAYPYGTIQGGRIVSAGKTGTTDERKDKWFIGYTPYYVGATWYGYDRATTMPEMGQALKIWKAVMDPIHAKLKSAQFTNPGGLISKTVCNYSGKLATPYCHQGVTSCLFLKGTSPTEACDYHVSAMVCSIPLNGEWLLAGQYCKPIERLFVTKKSTYSGASLPLLPDVVCVRTHNTPAKPTKPPKPTKPTPTPPPYVTPEPTAIPITTPEP